jgi:ferric-dicitrate binding protein FerR (iron transport regulator)
VGQRDDDSLGNGWLDEAFAWALCLREDLSAETVAKFDAWRSGAPEADAAWREVTRLWTLAGVALAAAPAAPVKRPGDRDPGADH